MRKTSKKLLSLLLALMMCLALLPTTALAADSDFAMKGTELTKYTGPGGAVTIPNGVTRIGYQAFEGCTSLTSVTIPNSVTHIDGYAFGGCTGLTSITIPASVTNIISFAFSECSNLVDIKVDPDNKEYTAVDGVLYTRDMSTLVVYPAKKQSASAFSIPKGVINIESHAFDRCTGVTTVVIPDSVTHINPLAFYRSPSLTSITIPDSVTYLGQQAFQYCTGLTSVTLSKGLSRIESSIFEGCTSLTGVTIPNGVTVIFQSAFKDCTNLVSVTIPDSVTDIWHFAFRNTPWLTQQGEFPVVNGILLAYQGDAPSVTLPNGITSVGYSAFRDLSGLIEVIIPAGVTDIEICAFYGCRNLTSLTIPSSVTSIEESAFRYCEKLTDIYYPGSEEQWNAIKIGKNNEVLASATIHCNSTGSDQPTTPEQPSTLPVVENIPATGTAVAQTQNVLLDGKTVQFQYYAVKDANGNLTNYVKLRDLAQALSGTKAQFNVGWDGKISITANTAYQSVGGEGSTPYSGDQSYTAVSSTPVSFNGKDVNLTSFQLKDSAGNGYTYYKLRDLGQLLNFNVTWNGSSIVVESDKPYTG